MSRALVINGADFTANKLDTVTLSDIVPCTGLSLSQDAVAFTEIGATQQIVATKTPSGATDPVEWVSSNENVVTVVDGLITVVGVGTAIITASCGGQTATCSVSVSVTVNANTQYLYVNGYEISSTNLESDPPKDYCGAYAASTRRAYAKGSGGSYHAFAKQNVDILSGMFPIVVPSNTSHITITCPLDFTRMQVAFMDSTEKCTNETALNNPAKVVSGGTGYIDISNGSHILDMDRNADSFIFVLRTGSGDASAVTGDVIVTFS